jgi:hypothetical protein
MLAAHTSGLLPAYDMLAAHTIGVLLACEMLAAYAIVAHNSLPKETPWLSKLVGSDSQLCGHLVKDQWGAIAPRPLCAFVPVGS